MQLPDISAATRLPDAEESAELLPGTSDRGFAIGLYLEHLEEAGFLYEQRLDLRDDPELTWRDPADFEERFEAHLDALVLGGDLALAVCEQQAREGDFGEMHAAVCVFCRHRRLDLVQAVLDTLDPADDERVQAAADALCHELPAEWSREVTRWLAAGGVCRVIAARVAGYRRLQVEEDLLRLLPPSAKEALPEIIGALGRLRYQPARVPLYERCLQHEDARVRTAAALALLRIGEVQTVHYCTSLARSQPWTYIPIGLGGNQSDAARLLTMASSGPPHPDLLHALGLLGDPAGVGTLLAHLSDADRAEAAALSLNLITGAELYEEVFVPDEVDEDELFEDEVDKLQRGEPLTPPEAAPPGITVTRLSQDAERWRAWWQQNQQRFRAGVRYRNGVPYTPTCLLHNLAAASSTRQMRQWAHEELVIRYGWPGRFETDVTVAHQDQVIREVAAWIDTQGGSFPEGKWYLAGNPAFW